MKDNLTSGPTCQPSAGIYDSTAINLFQTCPFKYYMSIEEGWTSEFPSDAALCFGEVLHAGLATLFQTGRLDLAKQTMTEHEHISSVSDQKGRSPEKLGVLLDAYWDRYKNSEMVVLNDEHGEPVVEYPFNIEIEPYVLSGRLDLALIDKKRGEIWIVDHKTTSSIQRDCKSIRPHTQFDNYVYAGHKLFSGLGRVMGIIVDFIEISKKLDDNNFMRVPSDRSAGEIEAVPKEFLATVRHLELCRISGFWHKHKGSCFDYFRPCDFTNLCIHGSKLGIRKKDSQ